MTILVTGATGFIGRYVVDALAKKNCRVIATSLEKSTELFDTYDRVRYVPCDLRQGMNIEHDYFEEQPDAVIHLAWGGLPNYSELFHIEENLVTSYCFLKSMIAGGCRNINVIGTCFEYGLQEGCLDEEMPAKPNTCYGLAKNTLRLFLEELQKHHDFDLKWIRLFYMYGEGQSKNSILEQLKSALDRGDDTFNMSGGEQLRDYLPVEKVAENIVDISMQTAVKGIINNCDGKPISIRRLVEEYVKKSGKSIKLNLGYYPYTSYEPHAFWGNVEKLNDIINRD